MASVKGGKCKRSTYRAKLATNIGPCVFCQRAVDDEIIYGKLYAIGDILCHYFCALLSCCLVQKVSEDEGLFGFRYQDILAEVERSKKHKCSYCNRDGANMGCCVAQCRKQFHLPCGREKNAVSLFYGNYKSFCVLHAPKQKVADYILPKVKLRLAEKRQEQLRSKNGCGNSEIDGSSTDECVCVVCCERVAGLPAPQSFWPPCCARDAWLHRPCLQRMALSAGMHYLKCPLCNDKDIFYKAVIDQGYYVPDRDAAWELEQGAFADIYERPASCSAVACNCPLGRAHSADTGTWDLKLCILCGSTAIHAGCADSGENTSIYVCSTCRPAAPEDLDGLVASIESVQLQEQASEVRQGPIMPSRMSLRRTKRRPFNNSRPSSSRILTQNQQENSQDTSKIETSRLDLNLKSPKRRVESTATTPLSPMKVLEAVQHQVQGGQLVALRERLRRPAPRVIKAAIVNKILEEFLNNNLKDPKSKEPLKEWNSPKKVDITVEDCKENLNFENATQHATLFTHKESNESPTKALKLQYSKSKNDFICNFKHRHIETKVDSSSLRTAIDFARDAYESNCSVRKRRLERDASGGKRRRMSEGGGEKGRGSVKKQETLGSDERSKISERDHSSEEQRREIYDCKDSRVEKTQEMSGNEDIGEEKRRTMSGSEDSSEEKRQRVSGGNSEEQRREMSESKGIGEGKNREVFDTGDDSEGKRQKMLDSETSDEGKRGNMSISEVLIELNVDNEEQTQRIIERDNSGSGNIQGIDREEDSIEKRQIIIDREDTSENTEIMSERENVIEGKRHSITIGNVEISLMVAERDGDREEKRQRVTHKEGGIDKNRRRLSRRVDKKRRRTINRKNSSEGKRQTIGEDIEKRRVISGEDSNYGKRQNNTDNVDGNENIMMEREGSIDEKRKMIEDCIEKETVDFETQNLSDVIDLSLVKTEIDDVRKRRNLSLKRKLKDNSDNDVILENKTKNYVTNADDDKISKKKKDRVSLKRKRKNSDAVLEIKRKKSVNNKSKSLKNISENNISLKINSTKGSEMVSDDNNENSKEDFVIKNKKRRLIKNLKNDCDKDIIDLTENTHFDSKTDKNNDLVDKVDEKRPKSKKDKILSKVKVQYKKNKKLSIQNRGFKVKIKWRKEQLNLKITDERKKSKKVKNTPKVLKQYVLKYSPEVTSPKDVIMKPEDNTPVKRKYVKTEKRTDNLVQTNISSFFKSTPKST